MFKGKFLRRLNSVRKGIETKITVFEKHLQQFAEHQSELTSVIKRIDGEIDKLLELKRDAEKQYEEITLHRKALESVVSRKGK